MDSFGNRLKQILKSKGMTQKRFSELVGKEDAYISKVCNDKFNVSLDTLLQFASVLEVSPDIFLKDDDAAGNDMVKDALRDLSPDLKELIRKRPNGPWLVLAKDLSETDLTPDQVKKVVELWEETVRNNRL